MTLKEWGVHNNFVAPQPPWKKRQMMMNSKHRFVFCCFLFVFLPSETPGKKMEAELIEIGWILDGTFTYPSGCRDSLQRDWWSLVWFRLSRTICRILKGLVWKKSYRDDQTLYSVCSHTFLTPAAISKGKKKKENPETPDRSMFPLPAAAVCAFYLSWKEAGPPPK